MMNSDQEIFNFLVQNQSMLKQLLIPIKEDAGLLLENDNFNQQFLDRAKWIVAANICFNLKLGVDSVMGFLDNVNIKELLK